MAKKAKKKTSKRGKSSSKKNMGFNINALLGMALGIYGSEVLLPKISFYQTMDPKMQSAVKILSGQFLPQQSFVKGVISDQGMLDGSGNALSVLGMKDLMMQMNMLSGDISSNRQMRDDDVLAIALKGIKDISTVNADVLGADISTVNADVLGSDYKEYVV